MSPSPRCRLGREVRSPRTSQAGPSTPTQSSLPALEEAALRLEEIRPGGGDPSGVQAPLAPTECLHLRLEDGPGDRGPERRNQGEHTPKLTGEEDGT